MLSKKATKRLSLALAALFFAISACQMYTRVDTGGPAVMPPPPSAVEVSVFISPQTFSEDKNVSQDVNLTGWARTLNPQAEIKLVLADHLQSVPLKNAEQAPFNIPLKLLEPDKTTGLTPYAIVEGETYEFDKIEPGSVPNQWMLHFNNKP